MSAPVHPRVPARVDASLARPVPAPPAADRWMITRDAPLPDRLHTGEGTVLLLGGLLIGPGDLSDVRIELGGRRTRVATHSMLEERPG